MSKQLDKPPAWRECVLQALSKHEDAPEVVQAVQAADTAKGYLHWSEFRRRPAPGGSTPEELWALVKLHRMGARRLPDLRTKTGKPFVYNRTDPVVAALHRIDTKEVLWKGLSSGGEAPDSDVSYRLMAAIEEAHHSSAIEGAVSTRRQSRELIRTGREPRGESERMILNNFRTIERLDEWVDYELTPELICEVHASIVDSTLSNSRDEGRIRTDDDVLVIDENTEDVLFVPPKAVGLAQRLRSLCEFANRDSSDELFVHPVTRAILIHHQLAYDHPFVDGNGRTARALFMWSILRSGYPWFRSLSISRAVHRARAQYYRAFRFVQSDEGDATYFVRQQLACVEREIKHLSDFLSKRTRLERWLIEKRAVSDALNSRQLSLVDYALRHPSAQFTAREHCQYHGVTQPTAWKDLTSMVSMRLLEVSRSGRKSVYRPSGKLKKLVKDRPKST